MKLYHYTAREYVPAIAAEGLWKGEVAVTPTDLLNAVWLTSDGRADGHGLTDGSPPTAAEKAILGLHPDTDARFPDKRAIRFTVQVPRGDRHLVEWNRWA